MQAYLSLQLIVGFQVWVVPSLLAGSPALGNLGLQICVFACHQVLSSCKRGLPAPPCIPLWMQKAHRALGRGFGWFVAPSSPMEKRKLGDPLPRGRNGSAGSAGQMQFADRA